MTANFLNPSSSFTHTTAAFTQSDTVTNVVVNVDDSSWMRIGSYVYIPGGGYYRVMALPSSTQVTLRLAPEVERTATGATIASGSVIAGTGATGCDKLAAAVNALDSVVCERVSSLSASVSAVSGAFNGTSIPIVPLQGTAGWSGGITDDYRGAGTGGALGVALPLYPGLALTSVLVAIEPSAGHGSMPSGMPFVNVYATSNTPHASAGIAGTVTDTTNNTTAYEVAHTLVLNLGTPLTTANTQSSWLRINDETGVSGLRLKSVKAIYA